MWYFRILVMGLLFRIRQLAWVWVPASSLASIENLDILTFLCFHLLTCDCNVNSYLKWLLWGSLIYVACLDQGLGHTNHFQNVINCYYKNLESICGEEMERSPYIRYTVKWREPKREFLTEESIHVKKNEFQFPTRGHSPPSESSNSEKVML